MLRVSALPSLQIVEANLTCPQHQRAVVELLNGYAGTPMGGGLPLSDAVRERLIPALQQQANRLILLALVEGEPVGIAVCFYGFSTFEAKPLVNIHDLAVHPAFQRRGIGRRLLAEVEQRARERGCCRVTLEVLERNHVARRLYRSQGFQGDSGDDATYFLKKPL